MRRAAALLIALATHLHGAASWNYTDTDRNWAAVSAACGQSAQSPIDLPAPAAHGARNDNLRVHMSPSAPSGRGLKNNGHGFVVEGGFGSTTVGGQVYEAIQFHLHFPSEHSVQGVLRAGELHIVHRRQGTQDYDDLLVVGVFFDLGAPSELLDALGWRAALPAEGQSAPISGTVDVISMLSAQLSGGFWRYDGSLTTPPCSQTVKWFVMSQPATASLAQISAAKRMYPDPANNRPVQPLNGRKVLYGELGISGAKRWGYDAADHEWPTVEPACSGYAQSPVDIPAAAQHAGKETLAGAASWGGQGGRALSNNGHGLAVAGDFGNTTVGGEVYEAVQFHLHFPSEHAVGGLRHAGELHMVHRRRGTAGYDDLLVIGIFFDIGPPSQFLNAIGWGGVLPAPGRSVPIAGRVDPGGYLGHLLAGGFWHYNGSLTTPPCSETVKWFVLQEAASVSTEQVAQFRGALGAAHNSRPLQPLHGRGVLQSALGGAAEAPKAHWDYADTVRAWPTVAAACGGVQQSPVDIPADALSHASAQSQNFLSEAAAYTAVSAVNISNNGHGISVESAQEMGSVTFLGGTYDVLGYHFHFPSEHTVDGVSHAGELHIVHRKRGTAGYDDLLVAGVFLDVGPESALLGAAAWAALPAPGVTAAVQQLSLSLGASLAQSLAGNFWHYNGSLTTPPCSETVKWFVFEEAHTVSLAQVAAFKALFPDPQNNRPPQPLGGRGMLRNSWTGAPTIPWGYRDPDKEWPAVNPQCAGGRQSPVNLRRPVSGGDTAGAHSRDADPLAARVGLSAAMRYVVLSGLALKNNGHSLVVEGSFGNTTVAGAVYEALQFHLHFPSEHTIDGKHAAGELHIVHRRQGTEGYEDLLVIGILLELGGTANAFLDDIGFSGALPHYGDPVSIAGALNISGAFAEQLSGHFWHYNGSLTTPPCSETVRWFVADTAARVSAEQVAKGRALFLHPSNSRPVQELGDRRIARDAFTYGAPNASVKSSWDYHDTDWAVSAHPDCGGSAQSPIDLPLPEDADGAHPRISDLMSHSVAEGDLRDSGHGIILEGRFGNTTVPAGQYEAVQFHFHFPSEHSVGGVLYTGELHIVHRRVNTTGYHDLLVVGVFLTLGAPSDFLGSLGWPESRGATADPLGYLASSLSGPFWHYNGSLTTPPCSETVKWFVMERPQTVSLSQVALFKKRYPDPANNRPVQPLGARTVLRSRFQEGAGEKHWDYQNSETRWPLIAPACGGWAQSPVDIPAAELAGQPATNPQTLAARARYVPVRGASLENNGHGFVVTGDFGSVSLGGEVYNAVQFHVHFPSEHTVDGVRAAGELHVVHRRVCAEGYADLLVVGVLLEMGATSALLEAVGWSALPDQGAAEPVAGAVDLGTALRTQMQGTFWHYNGSLTTPPCSETVRWFVLRTPMTVSAAQVAAFRAEYPSGNSRPTLPLHGRAMVQDAFGAAAHGPGGWGYEDPDAEWPAAAPQCAGSAQSPVDLPGAHPGGGRGASLSEATAYGPRGGLSLLNSGHGLKVSAQFGNVTYNGAAYDALQFHVHFPSEHSVDGVLRAGELHIVHRRRGTENYDDLLVIGIFFDVGAPSGVLDSLGLRAHGALPAEGNSAPVGAAINPAATFSEQLGGPFWHYNGSLTTPPCSETVKWFVLEQPASVSREQVSSFKRKYPNPANNRPVQPLNGRAVVRSLGPEREDAHWDYSATGHQWPEVSPACSGAAQSPVDLPLGGPVDGSAFRAATSFSTVSGAAVRNSGHGLSVGGSFGATTVRGSAYDAVQFHFHFPSEHTVGGSLYAGELHIVHRKRGTEGYDDLLVIGIFLELGAASSALDSLGWAGGLPLHNESVALSAPVDLASSFSAALGSGFWHYNGSLTTPPCSETVKWFVMKAPVSVSVRQVAQFKALYPDPANNRPVQGLNGREVVEGSDPSSAAAGAPPKGDFDYEDTRHWVSLNRICGGAAQSPVDLPHAGHGEGSRVPAGAIGAPLSRFSSYTDALTGLRLVNNGHGLKVAGGFGSIWVDGAEYRAVQFHLHFPSEHTVAGAHYAGELHLVHQKAGSAGYDHLLVLGVFLRLGAPSPLLHALGWDGDLPAAGNYSAVPGSVPLASALLPALSSPMWWRYNGSLTTPPCTESARWLVAGGPPLTVSPAQVAKWTALFPGPGNSRPTQPLYNRAIERGALALPGEQPEPHALEHFNYTDTDFFWPRLAARCAGPAQSPIDLPSAAQGSAHGRRLAPAAQGAGASVAAHMVNWGAMDQRQLKNNGHGLVVEGAIGSTMLFGSEYEAVQFHLHFPSEHTVGGTGFAGELHVVHRRKGTEGYADLLVIGILLSEGAASGFLDGLGFGRTLPAESATISIPGRVDLRKAFAEQLEGRFWHYKGSLTTPPCTESVKWIVMEKPATVSAAQVAKFRALFPSPANSRPVQPLNGRAVLRDQYAEGHSAGCPTRPGWDYANSAAAWHAASTACSGSAQSPVDLPGMPSASARPAGGPISRVAFTGAEGRRIRNNGHALVVEGAFGKTELAYGEYEAIQFHLHFPSEHTIGGSGAAGEMHIVHRRVGTSGYDDLAVIGILLSVGAASSFLDGLGWSALPSAGHAHSVGGEVDLASAFSAQLAGPYWHYNGSLTTPPCSETVKWFVMGPTATVSAEQVAAFKALFPDPANNRPVQPLHNRTVATYSSQGGEDDGEGRRAAALADGPGATWGYQDTGAAWVAASADCGRYSQSPIDIRAKALRPAESPVRLSALMQFAPVGGATLTNNGHGLIVSGDFGNTTLPALGPGTSTLGPTGAPTAGTLGPTGAPTAGTLGPTVSPSAVAAGVPTAAPSGPVAGSPTASPAGPPIAPSPQPTGSPTAPTAHPSLRPSLAPTTQPTAEPTAPTAPPTIGPTAPTGQPTGSPSAPSGAPTAPPSGPTGAPSPPAPSASPSQGGAPGRAAAALALEGGAEERYEAVQFHFHFPSEHTVDGVRYDGEVHIVHKDSNSSALLVIGVFFRIGQERSAFLDTLGWDAALPASGFSVPVSGTVNPKATLASQLAGGFWHYEGSLTTPPCSETVKWFVMEEPVTVSLEQVAAFKRLYPDPANYRPVQGLNSRSVARSALALPHSSHSWNYSDTGAGWQAASPTCAGNAQSPIDLDSHSESGGTKLGSAVSWAPLGGLQLRNTGHGLQVDGAFGNFSYRGARYEALQLHLHFPAEHSVDGQLDVGELHIVHRRAGTAAYDDLLVVGVLLSSGAESALLSQLGMGGPLPASGGAVGLTATVDLSASLSAQLAGGFWHYHGSLTTPPCSETVKWFVSTERMAVSTSQVQAFKALYPDPANNRPTLPRNGREVARDSFEPPGPSAAHWGYAHAGSDWGKAFPDCSGQRQSPIDLHSAVLPERSTGHGGLHFNYGPGVHQGGRIDNTGHGIKVSGVMSGGVYIGGAQYDALQFHLHFPSEHTVDGVRRAGELHIVHQKQGSSDLNDLLVVGVFLDLGEHSELLDAVGWAGGLPTDGGSRSVGGGVDLGAVLAPQLAGHFWHYNGSLTTPPCSETVKWFVMERALTVSHGQVAAFKELYPGVANSRAVQAPHGRAVLGGRTDCEADPHWTYSDPDSQWPHVSADCGGSAQSPIDMPLAAPPAETALDLLVAVVPSPQPASRLRNNGHGVVVEGTFGVTTIGGAAYDAIQFHLHFPSEHTVGGVRYAGELHIVHRRRGGSGGLAVIGVLLELGAPSALLELLSAAGKLPMQGQSAALPGSIDPFAAFATQLSGPYWHYNGSLTTPPCSETVRWFVLGRPATVSLQQAAAFRALYPAPGNNRPVQPLNGRSVVRNGLGHGARKIKESLWDYQNPAVDWPRASFDCGGRAQSPIDLPAPSPSDPGAAYPQGLGGLLEAGALRGREMRNNGHGLVVDGAFSTVTAFRGRYDAAQFHLHFPSEHTVSGSPREGELHVVHRRRGSPDELLVVGVFLQIANRSSPFVSDLLAGSAAPPEGSCSGLGTAALNISAALAPQLAGGWWHYNGSLTTPPCSETVKWIVAARPLDISQQDAAVLKAPFPGGNSRPVQELNGRLVLVNSLGAAVVPTPPTASPETVVSTPTAAPSAVPSGSPTVSPAVSPSAGPLSEEAAPTEEVPTAAPSARPTRSPLAPGATQAPTAFLSPAVAETRLAAWAGRALPGVLAVVVMGTEPPAVSELSGTASLAVSVSVVQTAAELNSIADFEAEFAATMATILEVDADRIPPESVEIRPSIAGRLGLLLQASTTVAFKVCSTRGAMPDCTPVTSAPSNTTVGTIDDGGGSEFPIWIIIVIIAAVVLVIIGLAVWKTQGRKKGAGGPPAVGAPQGLQAGAELSNITAAMPAGGTAKASPDSAVAHSPNFLMGAQRNAAGGAPAVSPPPAAAQPSTSAQ